MLFTIFRRLRGCARIDWQALIPAHSFFHPNDTKGHGLGEQVCNSLRLREVGKKWKLRPVDEDSTRFGDGPFYVSWDDGKKKHMDPVDRDLEHELRMAHLKRATLAYISAGGEVEAKPVPAWKRNSPC